MLLVRGMLFNALLGSQDCQIRAQYLGMIKGPVSGKSAVLRCRVCGWESVNVSHDRVS